MDISASTIERVRQRFVEESLVAPLQRKPQQRHKPHRLDGEQEAHLIALTCGAAPEGYGRWSLRLLAERMVELDYVETVSHETVRQTLKKRTQALVKPVLGDSAQSQRRGCLSHGSCVGCLQTSL